MNMLLRYFCVCSLVMIWIQYDASISLFVASFFSYYTHYVLCIFSTLPHAHTRIYDVHISYSIRNLNYTYCFPNSTVKWIYDNTEHSYWRAPPLQDKEAWMADVTDTSKDTGKRTIQFSTKGLKAFEDECAKIKLPIIETWKNLFFRYQKLIETLNNIKSYIVRLRLNV